MLKAIQALITAHEKYHPDKIDSIFYPGNIHTMNISPVNGKASEDPVSQCIAFAGTRRIAAGETATVTLRVKAVQEQDPMASILVFDDATSEVVELDLRGARLDREPTREGVSLWAGTPTDARSDSSPEIPSPASPTRGPGRPKLGVVPREVTLLPRHWEWLATQPGGASVALRKLVEEARRANAAKDRQRLAREAAYRFMSAMAGNLPGFEEATRALFADDEARFGKLIAGWPEDIRDHSTRLAGRAFAEMAAPK